MSTTFDKVELIFFYTQSVKKIQIAGFPAILANHGNDAIFVKIFNRFLKFLQFLKFLASISAALYPLLC